MKLIPSKDPKQDDQVYQAPRGILGKFFMGLFGSTMTARPGRNYRDWEKHDQ